MNNKFKILGFLLLVLSITIYILNKPQNSLTTRENISLVNPQSSCIKCHTSMQGFAPAHSPQNIKCTDCHLGNNNNQSKVEAHKNMVNVPGNLSNASNTCAKCHPGIDHRVKNSMMNTMSGIIAVDKYVFGENDNLDSLFDIHHLENTTDAEIHLRNKCASCHIGNEKKHPDPITEMSRGGGCTACHLNYTEKGKHLHEKYIESEKTNLTTYHPSLSLNITDNHCFGCHSRSGRISTNYEGWHETTLKKTPADSSHFRRLEDQRIFEKKDADIHHTLGLSCIDCHDNEEVMGDGNTYAHQDEVVKIKCSDCHFSNQPQIAHYKDLSTMEQRIIKLKKMTQSATFVYTQNSTKILLNIINEREKNYLITKNTNQKLLLSKPTNTCTANAHENLSCTSCHTSWSPQCISCHTSYDERDESFDLLQKDWVGGNWVEKGDNYLARFPTLGIVIKDKKKVIKTFSPGMVMHLTQRDSSSTFHRLFAPTSAHTISKTGKGCKDCHNNPVALGYGQGQLKFNKGKWAFTPQFRLEQDSLPLDAWIPFLQNDTLNKSTRTHARPFTLSEQKSILEVGSCLTCHKENSKVVKEVLHNFKSIKDKRVKACFE